MPVQKEYSLELQRSGLLVSGPESERRIRLVLDQEDLPADADSVTPPPNGIIDFFDIFPTSAAIPHAHVRVAAGVPAGVPNFAAGELPIAYDSTAVSGGTYLWTGEAWTKIANIL